MITDIIRLRRIGHQHWYVTIWYLLVRIDADKSGVHSAIAGAHRTGSSANWKGRRPGAESEKRCVRFLCRMCVSVWMAFRAVVFVVVHRGLTKFVSVSWKSKSDESEQGRKTRSATATMLQNPGNNKNTHQKMCRDTCITFSQCFKSIGG